MKSNTWIKLLAYRDRAIFEDGQRGDRLDALRRSATRGRLFTELRLGIACELERRLNQVDEADCEISIGNGNSAQQFLVRVTDGCSDIGVMSLEATDEGAACRYAFGGRLHTRGGERDLQVLFDGDLVPARVSGATTHEAFTSREALCAFLLTPLLAGILS